MLHVNWLVGGVVVVEAIFGYPGLGSYIYSAAIFGDPNAVEAAAMLLVLAFGEDISRPPVVGPSSL